ncbi:MAG: serine/threonine-protein phosphatase, partial [Crocinitomicaceae bacterium]|nr:serine/threonine-protein phosphatase [Crocinitomicaceae bacterium]
PLLLFFLESKALMRYAPNKQPIGKFFQSEPFQQQSISLEDGDTIYLYSDGYIDQFGGPKGKKMKYRQLEDYVSRFANEEMNRQQDLFDQAFEDWKGENEQIDDVCLIGVRFDNL